MIDSIALFFFSGRKVSTPKGWRTCHLHKKRGGAAFLGVDIDAWRLKDSLGLLQRVRLPPSWKLLSTKTGGQVTSCGAKSNNLPKRDHISNLKFFFRSLVGFV